MALAAIFASVLCAQDAQPRLVKGSVRDESGAPLAGASVRIEVCNGPHATGVLAELRSDPLPRARSTSSGAFSLVMAPSHDGFDTEYHGQLALVVEFEGRQPWRELLPSPPRLYDGSDVVLPLVRDADHATIRVRNAPAGALVLLRRTARDGYVLQGGPPPGERYLLPVPANGELLVPVPLVPNPPTVPETNYFAVTGWTAQLVFPGATSALVPVWPGASFELPAAASPEPRAMQDETGERVLVARCLHRLPDDTLRWFPSVDGNVVEDERLPPVAVELAGARPVVVAASGTVRVADRAPESLRVVGADGTSVGRVRVAFHAPGDLGWTREGRLRPVRPPVEEIDSPDGIVPLHAMSADRAAAWITAWGHQPCFVLDVRALDADGRIALQPAPKRTHVEVVGEDGAPLAGVRLYSEFDDGFVWDQEGAVPRTDRDGRCTLPSNADWPVIRCSSSGHSFGRVERDDRTGVLRIFGRRSHLYRLRAVDERGTPVPFATLGYEVWTQNGDGTSSGTSVTTTADSRGLALLFGDPDRPPLVQPGELGHFPSGGAKLELDGATDIVVRRDPIVAVQVPATPGWAPFELPWLGLGRTIGGSTSFAPYDGHALLIRWPEELPFFVCGLDSGPPIVMSREEAKASALHVIDRRAAVRRTPLQLGGSVPTDLSLLHARPASIAGFDLRSPADFCNDYLEPTRSIDSLVLATRDLLEHEFWLMHPDALPEKARIPAGAAGSEPVTVELRAGAPCTLFIRLTSPMQPHIPVQLRVSQRTLFGRTSWVAALSDARLYQDAVTQGIELRAPFALPPGRFELCLSNGRCAEDVTVVGTNPVRVEFPVK